MATNCSTKTLELTPGVHSGTQNTEVIVASNAVELIGLGESATIDGGGTRWILSVFGNGSLTLKNLTLQHAFLSVGGGAALSVDGQGAVRATGVQFRDNKATDSYARGGAVSVIDSNAKSDQWLDAQFVGCTWDGNLAGFVGGGLYAKQACPSFTACLWRNNTAGKRGGLYEYGGGLVVNLESAAVGAPTVALTDCTFEFNWCWASGGGTCILNASPSFTRCVWLGKFDMTLLENEHVVLAMQFALTQRRSSPSASAPSCR
jgi:hypothetical protein